VVILLVHQLLVLVWLTLVVEAAVAVVAMALEVQELLL
jgi:hypothetical protein